MENINKQFNKLLEQFIDKTYYQDSDILSLAFSGEKQSYDNETGLYSYDFIDDEQAHLEEFVADFLQNEGRKELMEYIEELHEHIDFTDKMVWVFTRMFKVSIFDGLNYTVSICENKRFQEWCYNRILTII